LTLRINMNNDQPRLEENNANAQNAEGAIPTAPVKSEDLVRTKNPNPAANDNIDNGMIDAPHENGVGSEITDGDGG